MEMKDDLIRRQDAIDMFQRLAYDDWNQGVSTSWADAYAECAEMLRDLPSAQPDRKTGEWVKTGQSFVYPNSFKGYSCSCCGFFIRKENPLFLFCPSCGAEMKGEDDAEVH